MPDALRRFVVLAVVATSATMPGEAAPFSHVTGSFARANSARSPGIALSFAIAAS